MFERLRQRWGATTIANQLTVIATIFIAVATVVNLGVAIAMWHEMHEGGIDTKNLADAAGRQATNTYNLSTTASTQETDTANLVAAANKEEADFASLAGEAAKQQADTHDLAVAAKAQSESTSEQVTQASRLATDAETANADTKVMTEIHERPWVGIDIGKVTLAPAVSSHGAHPADSVVATLDYSEHNYGSSPALRVVTQFRIATDAEPVRWRVDKACIDASHTSEEVSDRGMDTLFPSQLVDRQKGLGPIRGPNAWIVVCVAYGEIADPKITHTTAVKLLFVVKEINQGLEAQAVRIGYVDAK